MQMECTGTVWLNMNAIYCRRSAYVLSNRGMNERGADKTKNDPVEENIEKVILAFRSARIRMLDILKEQRQLAE